MIEKVRIIALPKLKFDESFTSETMKNFHYACFISILDPDNDEDRYDSTLDNFLKVKMWDIEETLVADNGRVFSKPSDKELDRIYEFIQQHKDKVRFVVHCSAGISRSGAVAEFIKEIHHENIDKEQYMKDNKYIQPNLYILKELRKRIK